MGNLDLVFLPNEIINKILMYRVSHPIICILKPIIEQYNEYNEYFSNDGKKPFYYYFVNVLFYYNHYETLFKYKKGKKKSL